LGPASKKITDGKEGGRKGWAQEGPQRKTISFTGRGERRQIQEKEFKPQREITQPWGGEPKKKKGKRAKKKGGGTDARNRKTEGVGNSTTLVWRTRTRLKEIEEPTRRRLKTDASKQMERQKRKGSRGGLKKVRERKT